MKDADFATQRERVVRYFERWIPVFGFERYRLAFHFLGFEASPSPEQQQRNVATLIESCPQWEYQAARFNCFLPTIARLAPKDDDLEWHVVHELSHIWSDELVGRDQREQGMHEERVCSQIATAMLALRDAVVISTDSWRRVTALRERPTIALDMPDSDGDVEGFLRR